MKTREQMREEKRRQREREGPEVTRAKWREWYANNREHRLAYEAQRRIDTNRAKSRLHHYTSHGLIERPDKCSQCGVECRPQAHHYDYGDALEVAWLCTTCHSDIHVKLREEAYS